jgi:hypothetical protein
MAAYHLLETALPTHVPRLETPVIPLPGKRHKTNGPATAALLIQLASELLETSPTLRKRMGVTLSDLAAAAKVRKELGKR